MITNFYVKNPFCDQHSIYHWSWDRIMSPFTKSFESARSKAVLRCFLAGSLAQLLPTTRGDNQKLPSVTSSTHLGSSLIWTERFSFVCLCSALIFRVYLLRGWYRCICVNIVSLLIPRIQGWGSQQHASPKIFVPEIVSHYEMSQKLTSFLNKEQHSIPSVGTGSKLPSTATQGRKWGCLGTVWEQLDNAWSVESPYWTGYRVPGGFGGLSDELPVAWALQARMQETITGWDARERVSRVWKARLYHIPSATEASTVTLLATMVGHSWPD